MFNRSSRIAAFERSATAPSAAPFWELGPLQLETFVMRSANHFVLALSCGIGCVSSGCGSNRGGTDGTGGSAAASGGAAVGHEVPSNGTTFVVGSGGTAGASGSSTTTGTSCAQQEVEIQAIPPDILIVMDRSTSMTADLNGQSCAGGARNGNGNCGVNSKWYQSKTAIETVVSATKDKVNWGLFWLGNESTQCVAATTPAVPIAGVDSYDQIQQALENEAFAGQSGTPTAAVVNNALAYLLTLTDPNPKYMLVATDGEPNCANGTTGSSDATGAANAAANALKNNIGTFVVGIATTSSTTATSALNQMAVAGGHPQQGAATQYYAVSDTASLEAVLSQIVGMVASCTISLSNTPSGDWTIAIAATNSSTKQAVEIPQDPTNGWQFTDSKKTAILLTGTACDNLKTGVYSNISFVYTCAGGHIIIG